MVCTATSPTPSAPEERLLPPFCNSVFDFVELATARFCNSVFLQSYFAFLIGGIGGSEQIVAAVSQAAIWGLCMMKPSSSLLGM